VKGEGCHYIYLNKIIYLELKRKKYASSLTMMEEHAITLKFNKDNLENSLTPMIQQPHDQPNKIMPLNNKGGQIRTKWCLFTHHILLSKGEKNVGSVMDHIKSGVTFTHLKSQPPTLTLTNHVPICIGVM
jgi:hypothetical protein